MGPTCAGAVLESGKRFTGGVHICSVSFVWLYRDEKALGKNVQGYVSCALQVTNPQAAWSQATPQFVETCMLSHVTWIA